MADLLLNPCVNFASGRFKAMLTDGGYIPSQRHQKRSDVTDEISGVGYKPGGFDVAVSMVKKLNAVEITLGGFKVPLSTLTARYAVYYSNNDELVAVIDFEEDRSSKNGSFELGPSVIRVLN